MANEPFPVGAMIEFSRGDRAVVERYGVGTAEGVICRWVRGGYSQMRNAAGRRFFIGHEGPGSTFLITAASLVVNARLLEAPP